MARTILYVAPQAQFFLSHRVRIASAALSEGWKVLVACPPSPETAEIARLGLEYLPLPVARAGLNPLKEAATLGRLLLMLVRHRPTVTHLITAKAALWGGLACKITGSSSVTAITGLGFVFTEDSFRNRAIRKIILALYRVGLNRTNNHFIFQNNDDRLIFEQAGILELAGSTLLPGAGVDLSCIYAQPTLPDPPVVCLPARMLRMKGVEDFRAAGIILREAGIAVTMRLIGDPDPSNPTSLSAEELRTWVAAGDLEWGGYESDMNRALAACHIVALPSRGGEGLPKSLIDAAAAGRPSVATSVPGCREAILDGATGLLCRPRDPSDLAAKLRILIEDRALREQMGANARGHAEAVFDIRLVIRAHIELYDRLSKLGQSAIQNSGEL